MHLGVLLVFLLTSGSVFFAPISAIADCVSERPLSLETLFGFAAAPQTRTIQDFLAQIPANSLETFSLAYESRSAQATGVTPLRPRVVRTDLAGRVTLAYGCNPDSATYNQAEIIHFDETRNRYDFYLIDFRPQTARSQRIVRNPVSCRSCHGSGQAARPIWHSYRNWPGFFGSDDDDLNSPLRFRNGGPGPLPTLVAAGASERLGFETFRRHNRGNVCYESLPGLQREALDSPYPYVLGVPNELEARPNLRITKAFARGIGVQNFNRAFPRDSSTRYRRMLHAAHLTLCDRGIFARHRVTFGIPETDWTIDPDGAPYNSGQFSTDATTWVMSLVLQELSDRNAAIRHALEAELRHARPYYQTESWSCLEPQYAAIVNVDRPLRHICPVLEDLLDMH